MSCARCGTDLVARARYCHQCGERAVAGALQLDQSQIVEPRSGWRTLRLALIAIAGLAALLWLTQGLWLGVDPVPAREPAKLADRVYESEPPPDAEPVKPAQAAQSWYAVRTAKLRSSMTTGADNVVGTLARGEEVKGSVETGLDDKTGWLNTGEKGPYVAVLNLSEKPPPPLDLAVELALESENGTVLYSAPGDETGFSVATIPAGATLKITGVIDGWFEVLLSKGGVGYFKPADKASKRAMAKALAVLDKSGNDEDE
jgi:hypothetical protein